MDRLSALEAFVRLNELGTFSAVSAALRVRQSTVSKWIAALEDELGVQLVERTTRRLRFTDAGNSFLLDAREVLSTYEHATRRMSVKAPSLQGRLRISVPVVFGRLFVTQEVRKFLQTHRLIEVELVFSDRYVNLIEEGIDVAVRVGSPVDSSYRSHVLGETKRHLVASPKYLEHHGTPKHPKELERHSCIAHSGLSRGDVWRLHKDRSHFDVAVRGRFAANNSEAVRTMAKSHLGIALLADWLVESDLKSGRLSPILSDFALPSAPIRALTAPNRFPHPRVTTLIEHLKASLGMRFAPGAIDGASK